MLRWIFLLFALAMAVATPASAKQVELRLSNNLVAKAEYQAGDPAKPSVLLVHGFLQTYDFPTIIRLANGLASAGYSVLAPTLTLGVTHRKQSLACEAIHTHTMNDSVQEIAQWVAWLKQRNTSSIVLLGHSFGSVETLAYLSAQPDPMVRKLIGVSAVDGSMNSQAVQRERMIKQLRVRVKRGDKELVTRHFSFCRKYQATPQSMLSYLEWTPNKVIAELSNLPVPVTFIMGGRDERLGANWIDQLKKTKAKVRIIGNANHFMDGDCEFDLFDNVLLELKSL